MIELVAIEIETTNQASHRAVFRIHRDERSLNLRHLGDAHHVLVVLRDAQHGTAAQPLARRGGLGQCVFHEANAVALKGVVLAIATRDDHAFGVGLEHDCGQQVVAVRELLLRAINGLGERLFGFFGVFSSCGKLNVGFGAAEGVTALVLKHTATQ